MGEGAAVPNLHVMMELKSLCSKDLVKMKFNWGWFYYFLQDLGITALQEELHKGPDCKPVTLTKQTKGLRPGQKDDDDYEGRKGGYGKGFGKGGGYGKGFGGKGRVKEKVRDGVVK